MPTLMTRTGKKPGVPPAQEAPSIALTIQGIKFCLEPSDVNGEFSYKSAADGGIVVSLKSFTGTLKISQKGDGSVSVLPADSTSSAVTDLARTVEEEPDSPGVVSGKGAKKVSPGQQKLAFSQKGKAGNKKTTNKASRKRTNDDSNPKTPKASSSSKTKRTRVSEEKPPQKKAELDTSLSQQPSQEEMSLPIQQTMDSGSVAMASETESEQVAATKTSITSILKTDSPKDTVKDILDRVDSTASVKNDEEEDEVATRMEGEEDGNSAMDDDKQDGPIDDTQMDVVDTETDFKGYGPPSPRWGHTMTEVHDGKFLVYGGQAYDKEGNAIICADVHTYCPKTKTWDEPVNTRGEKRQWHSAIYVEKRKQMIAFGGETVETVSTGKNTNKKVFSDTLRVLDTDIMLWYPPAATGDIPTGRSGHSCVFFEQTDEMVVFGGVRGSTWLNTVSVLDISSWVWTTPRIDGSTPKPRSFHSATSVGKKMVVFGGNGKTSCFNTVHVLEAGGNNQSESSSSDGLGWKWSHPTVKGEAPLPRTGHSATLLDDGKSILIYGGWDPNEEGEDGGENVFESSYVLDTEEWTWKEGPKPVSIGSGTDSHTIDDCGPKRSGHRAVLNSDKQEILVFGGLIPGEALCNDMQSLVLPQGD
ncbi:MAG: hypothetical protein SGILL_004912 [Bacillariaceae sp.]